VDERKPLMLAIPMKRSAILRMFHAYSDGGNEAGFGHMTILSSTVLGHMTISAILRLFHAYSDGGNQAG